MPISARWRAVFTRTTSAYGTIASSTSWGLPSPILDIARGSPPSSGASFLAELIGSGKDSREIGIARQAMIAILDEVNDDFRPLQPLGKPQRCLIGHIGIGHAVQQPHRA